MILGIILRALVALYGAEKANAALEAESIRRTRDDAEARRAQQRAFYDDLERKRKNLN